MPKETKFTLLLLVILAGCFGFVVWQKMEAQKKLLAELQNKPTSQEQNPNAAKPGQHSPFDQYANQPPKHSPTDNKSTKEEPRRLPFDAGPPQNPFDGNLPRTALVPTDKHQKNPPTQTADLFAQNTSNNTPAANPFDGYQAKPGLQTPVAQNPNGAAQNGFSQPPGKTPTTSPFDGLPTAQQQTTTTTTTAKNPFDGVAPQAGNHNQQTAQNSPKSVFPAGSAAGQGQFAPSPFDTAAGNASVTTTIRPASDSKPAGSSFNPFDTPVQTKPAATPKPATANNPTEQKPAAPTTFNPFDAPTQTAQNGNNAQNNTNQPTNAPTKPTSVPSPFDSFPMPTSKTDISPELSPQKPAGEAPKYTPSQNTFNGNGFPTDDKFTPPKTIDQQGPVNVYTVRTDETYWSISRKLYGSIKYFQALAEHNRHRVGDPTRLQPGMKILVPDASVLDKLYAKLIPGSENQNGDTGAVPEGIFFTNAGQPMFRVGEDDTLGSIAYKHLGRSSRWVEIYNLNRDKLSTPDRLKLGLILKLPDDASRVALESDPRILR